MVLNVLFPLLTFMWCFSTNAVPTWLETDNAWANFDFIVCSFWGGKYTAYCLSIIKYFLKNNFWPTLFLKFYLLINYICLPRKLKLNYNYSFKSFDYFQIKAKLIILWYPSGYLFQQILNITKHFYDTFKIVLGIFSTMLII